MLHEFENLPTLTTQQANAIAALSACGSLYDACNQTNLSYDEFIDCLSSEAAQAHLAAARQIAEQRTRTRIADAAHTATEALERIAADPTSPIACGNDPNLLTERRRAATTLIRAFSVPTARRPARKLNDIDVAKLLNKLITACDSSPEHGDSSPHRRETSPERSDTDPERSDTDPGRKLRRPTVQSATQSQTQREPPTGLHLDAAPSASARPSAWTRPRTNQSTDGAMASPVPSGRLEPDGQHADVARVGSPIKAAARPP